MDFPSKVERQKTEFPGEHLKFDDLRKKIRNGYLDQTPPNFPLPVEFCVSNLRHDTNLAGFRGILSDGGIKGPLVWWSLSVSEDEIKDAEWRALRHDRMNEDETKPFLHKFTSSPAFRKSSRYGNFRFRVSLNELLTRYADQFCHGEPFQMRIYGTVVYKKEVMYAIVVHGPSGESRFGKFPLLHNSPNAVCAFKDRKMLWRPEGMSAVRAFRLSSMQAYRVPMKKRKYYSWDHVAVAFHVPDDKIFKFGKEMLVNHLHLCQGAIPKLSPEDFIECDFEASPLVALQ